MYQIIGRGPDKRTSFNERLINRLLERAALAPWWNLVKLIGLKNMLICPKDAKIC